MSTKENIYQITKYDLFYALPSYAMVPELMQDNRKSAFWWILYGLRLDDAWDYDIDRKVLNGHLVNLADFKSELPEKSRRRLRLAELKFRRSARNLPSDEQEHYVSNFELFSESVSFVESLALAIPYDQELWTRELQEKYRTLVAIIWGAMYVATVPDSSIKLFDTHVYAQQQPVSQVNSALINYHDANVDYYMQTPEGKRALSLAYQMTFGQMVTDQNDVRINYELCSPSFLTPGSHYSNDEYLMKQNDLLNKSRGLDTSRFSMTRSVARLFDTVYKVFANGSDWRQTLDRWQEVSTNVEL